MQRGQRSNAKTAGAEMYAWSVLLVRVMASTLDAGDREKEAPQERWGAAQQAAAITRPPAKANDYSESARANY